MQETAHVGGVGQGKPFVPAGKRTRKKGDTDRMLEQLFAHRITRAEDLQRADLQQQLRDVAQANNPHGLGQFADLAAGESAGVCQSQNAAGEVRLTAQKIDDLLQTGIV